MTDPVDGHTSMVQAVPISLWLAAIVTIVLTIPRAAFGFPPIDQSAFAFDQRIGNQVDRKLKFITPANVPLKLGDALNNRPAILVLSYFHCPSLCGLVRGDVMEALSHSGLDGSRDYSLVIVSIDPAETPADAKSAQAQDAARFSDVRGLSDWHYLTGSKPAIDALTHAVGFRSQFDAESKQFLHPAGLVFLSPDAQVSGYLLGLGYKSNDVRLGVTRAAQGITARALPVLLICFHFDPLTGKYTFAVMRVLQLGGALTVLVIGGTLALAFWRGRRLR